jgi:hypothetical protein
MDTNFQGLFNRTTAHWAKLACLSGINFWALSPIVFRFVGEHKQELTPAGITYAFAYVGSGKTNDIKLLNKDNPMFINQATAQFMVKITALVGNLLVQVANLVAKFSVLATIPLAARAHLLELRQLRFTNPKPPRIINQFTCRQGREIFKTHINPNAFGWRGQRLHVGQLNHKDSVPVAQAVTLDNYHFDCGILGQGAMLEYSYKPHALNVQPAINKSKPVIVLIANRLKPTFTFISGVSSFLSALDSAKESAKSLVEFSQGLLNRGVIDKGCVLIKGTNRLKLFILVNVTNTFSVHLPGQTALGQGVVIETSVNLKDALKRLALLFIRIKAICVS